jgi:hypothetical protein
VSQSLLSHLFDEGPKCGYTHGIVAVGDRMEDIPEEEGRGEYIEERTKKEG